MFLYSRNGLLALGVIFHVVYLFSIFDIYFRSPLVHGMTPYKIDQQAPAKRLFLIVADGLRADKLFEPFKNSTNPSQSTLAPYLNNIIRTEASYGISHTQVPTESRPGHVAIIAGFYEDVSAVTKGWKMNPVEFDSVFNQSSHTWSFGSPDILPMFAQGATDKSKVDTIMYSHEFEDFAQEASHLDKFVYDKLYELFQNATYDPILDRKLRQDGVVFFMHLLGIDTNGHAFKPFSKEYLNNISYVDEIVKKTVDLVNKFYNNDNFTSYIVTADHGMHDQGVHGDGHPDNTRTPIIAWGAGISKPSISVNSKIAKGHDEISSTWDIQNYERKDINQADIAPLMSSLIGIPFPMNSVGHLPLPYLNTDDDFKVRAMYTNARQILEQFIIKEEEKRRTRFNFNPFHPLSESRNMPLDRLSRARHQIATRDYSGAFKTCDEAIRLGLQGLKYYQKYDWAFLRSIITAGYLGWIAFSLVFIFKNYTNLEHKIDFSKLSSKQSQPLASTNDSLNSNPNISQPEEVEGLKIYEEWGYLQYAFVIFTAIFSIYLLYYQEAPFIYYGYVGFPLFFWFESLRSIPSILNSIKYHDLFDKYSNTNIVTIILTILSLEALVYGYYNRTAYTFIMIFLSFGWVFVLPKNVARNNAKIVAGWIFFCLTTSMFTLLPVEKGEHLLTSTFGGLCISLVGVVSVIYCDKLAIPTSKKTIQKTSTKSEFISSYENSINFNKLGLSIQTFFALLSTLLVYITSISLKNRTGLPLINQFLSWVLILVSSIIPYIHLIPFLSNFYSKDQHYLHRLITIFLSFGTPMILLSISYESLFYCSLFGVLVFWIMLERVIYNTSDSNLLLSQQSNRISDLPGFSQESKPSNANFNLQMSGSSTSTKKNSRLRTNIIHLPGEDMYESDYKPEKPKNIDINLYKKTLKYDNLRTAIIFLMLINLAFFGTGNIASLASFQLESVYRLITVFNPFLMSILLIYKIFMPFFIVSSAFAVINLMLELPPFSLFLLALSTTDIMTLNFFFMVKDEGSWLDIGTSISHYCISSLFVLFSIVLFSISVALVGKILIPSSDSRSRSSKKSG
ncbi:GPI ethanolamine phosphate transferase 1 [Smittium culicis]|uniref:GPI ethanolamine phosphate transferase 1 n=1 Tax=Smittium culicis TaxID=133412 RepID=A0A1R1YAP7_9FUNG|nr:GPI ethanolamine phosphate transferase 1 [Smittium culicis]